MPVACPSSNLKRLPKPSSASRPLRLSGPCGRCRRYAFFAQTFVHRVFRWRVLSFLRKDRLIRTVRVAIFDGGLPKGHPVTKWAKPIDPPGIGDAWSELQKHGVGVTSAFLWAHRPVQAAGPPVRACGPLSCLDTTPGQDPYELYEVLGRIDSVLVSKKYDFINLSIGPISAGRGRRRSRLDGCAG